MHNAETQTYATPGATQNKQGITPAQRARRSGHRPLCIWLTGLSGAGKTSLARGVELRLHARGLRTMSPDGDDLRADLCSDLDFSASGRSENLRRAALVARYLTEAGNLVLCAFVSPLAADRKAVREVFAPGQFYEVYVKCPLDTCRARDPKGLYRRSRAGVLRGLTGVDAPYEAPASPELVVDTDTRDADSAASQLEAFVLAQLEPVWSEAGLLAQL